MEIKSEEFKKNEGLAQKVMDLLIDDYFNGRDKVNRLDDKEYKNIIVWSLRDYESCGFDMSKYKVYSGVFKDGK